MTIIKNLSPDEIDGVADLTARVFGDPDEFEALRALTKAAYRSCPFMPPELCWVAEVEGRWRKSYWLQPMVEPASVTHVLVAVGETEDDLSPAWPVDSVMTRRESILDQRSLADSLAAITDSVAILRARLERLQHGDTVRGGRR